MIGILKKMSLSVFGIWMACGVAAPWTARADTSATLELHVSLKKPEPVLGVEIEPRQIDFLDLKLGEKVSKEVRATNTGHVNQRLLITIPVNVYVNTALSGGSGGVLPSPTWNVGPQQGYDIFTLAFYDEYGNGTLVTKPRTPARLGAFSPNNGLAYKMVFGAPTDVSHTEQNVQLIFTVEQDDIIIVDPWGSEK